MLCCFLLDQFHLIGSVANFFHGCYRSDLQQRSRMSVDTLRKLGTDFEGRVAVCQGAPKKPFFKILLPFLFDQRDFVTYSEIARFAVIRGGVCFIFLEATDASPLYAFSLANLVAEVNETLYLLIGRFLCLTLLSSARLPDHPPSVCSRVALLCNYFVSPKDRRPRQTRQSVVYG